MHLICMPEGQASEHNMARHGDGMGGIHTRKRGMMGGRTGGRPCRGCIAASCVWYSDRWREAWGSEPACWDQNRVDRGTAASALGFIPLSRGATVPAKGAPTLTTGGSSSTKQVPPSPRTVARSPCSSSQPAMGSGPCARSLLKEMSIHRPDRKHCLVSLRRAQNQQSEGRFWNHVAAQHALVGPGLSGSCHPPKPTGRIGGGGRGACGGAMRRRQMALLGHLNGPPSMHLPASPLSRVGHSSPPKRER